MRLHWLAPALSDLERIGDYIARDNPDAAERVAGRIVGAVERLAEQPGMA